MPSSVPTSAEITAMTRYVPRAIPKGTNPPISPMAVNPWTSDLYTKTSSNAYANVGAHIDING